jgi:hypothetical protein
MDYTDQQYAQVLEKCLEDRKKLAGIPHPVEQREGYAQAGVTEQQQVMGIQGNQGHTHSLRDEALKSASYHQERADKISKTADFLTRHPEFEEFIALVRSGAIQF